ncbi:MAG TPA: helix-turn-helix domain-containing protein [Allosphingosinicella sp.]|jgi:DNA-binding MarR family transcriptional regulator|nr:helix-turn-helix domain-containing protein [Allosphingosinicella sp.]
MRERASKPPKPLTDGDYAALADFRYELRCFLFFSEQAARKAGISPQQHQALLSIRGAPGGTQTVGDLAKRLLIRPHSASGLASRLEEQGLLERVEAPDRRLASLRLTERAEDQLAALARVHLAELQRMRPLLRGLLERLDPAGEEESAPPARARA